MKKEADVLNVRLPLDLGAAFRRVAAQEQRSVNGQAIIYFQRCLIADGHYQASGFTEGRPRERAESLPIARDVAAGSAEPLPSMPPRLRLPSTRETTPTGVRVGAIMAAIAIEYRAEQGKPLGRAQVLLRQLLIEGAFPDVTDLASARAKGPGAWIKAGARPGLIEALFPGDREAMEAARKQANRIQMDRRLTTDVQLFIKEKHINGQGARVLRRLLAGPFAGMTIEEAVAKGPGAWLDAGVGEDVARKIFDEKTAFEARRRANARGNARKRLKEEAAASAR